MINETLGLKNITTLLLTGGIGKTSILQIITSATFKPANPEELHALIVETKNQYRRIKIPTLDLLKKAYNQSDKILEQSQLNDITLISINDPNYPKSLHTIPDPPVLLNVKGDSSCIQNDLSIAVVGTRSPTDYGRKIGENIAQKFAAKGFVIVSGLAQGCDTAAHQGCIQAGGKTIAVLAHGLDMIYPPENRELAEQILNSGGCLLSEYLWGTRTSRYLFIERDRLQSGLSRAVVVIETGVTGGTMHTVGFCLKQGRRLACINYPSDKRSKTSIGNQQLITEGKAIPLWNQAEIDAFINDIQTNKITPTISNIESKPVVKVETSQHDGMQSSIPHEISEISADSKPTKVLNSQSLLFPELKITSPITLSTEALAERLQTIPAFIITQSKLGFKHFFEWTRSKDPDKKGWRYNKSKKHYVETELVDDPHSS